MSIERRELFRILGVAALAERAGAQHHHAGNGAPSPAKLRFFSEHENRLVEEFSDVILPADAHSPGAKQAGVSRLIDLVLHYGDAPAREAWKRAMEAVDAEARSRHGKPFSDCARHEQEQIVARMAGNEGRPGTELERFFEQIKALTIEMYHYSKVGLEADIGYKGPNALDDFPGCTHPEHQQP